MQCLLFYIIAKHMICFPKGKVPFKALKTVSLIMIMHFFFFAGEHKKLFGISDKVCHVDTQMRINLKRSVHCNDNFYFSDCLRTFIDFTDNIQILGSFCKPDVFRC